MGHNSGIFEIFAYYLKRVVYYFCIKKNGNKVIMCLDTKSNFIFISDYCVGYQ